MNDNNDNPKKELASTTKKKAAVLKALEVSLGVVSDACKKVNMSRNAYYEWIKNDEDFAKAADAVQELALDFTESMMFKRIRGYDADDVFITQYKGEIIREPIIKHYPPEPSLIKFHLATIGKNRGYVERQEHGGIGGDAITLKVIRTVEGE